MQTDFEHAKKKKRLIPFRQIWNELRYSRIFREIFWSFALKASSVGFGFLTTVLLARLLGARGYGIYAYAYSLVMLLAMPAHAGLPNLVVRETARGLAEGRPSHVRGIWQWAGRFVAILSLALLLFVGPILVLAQGGLNSLQGQTMAWALLLIPTIALGNVRGAALRGIRRIVAGQIPEFFLAPALFLLFVGGIALLNIRVSPANIMALQFVAVFVAFLIGAWLLWRYTPESIRQAKPVSDPRGWLFSSITFGLITSFNVLNNQAGTVILGIFDTPDAVGRYRVAAQVAALAIFGLQAVNMVVAPRFADLWARGEKARLQRLVTRSAQIVLLFSLLVAGTFLLIGQHFFEIVFGVDFRGAYLPLLILLAGQTVNAATGSVGFLLSMTGHEEETARGIGMAVLVNIILGLLLVPSWGIIGAAIATAISTTVWNGLLWWYAWQRTGLNSTAFYRPAIICRKGRIPVENKGEQR